MHVRQQLREAVLTILHGLPTTGANVSLTPLANRNIHAANTPALRIFSESDSVQQSYDMSDMQQHALEIVVEIVAVGAAVDAVLDAVAVEVEAAMVAGFPLAFLQGTDFAFDGAGESPIGQARLRYQFEYAVRRGASEVML